MNYALHLFILALVAIAGCSSSGGNGPGEQLSPPEPPVVQAETKTFEITAKQWDFIPDTITVNKGDTVQMIINNIDVSHGITIPAFGVNEMLQPGKVTEFEFVADQRGSFPFFCNVYCGAGHGEMSGT